MDHKEDLRVKRTEKMINEAFTSLLYEKSFDQITIQEIAYKAMINRNTFYLHYRDKGDLLEKISETCIDNLKEAIGKLRLNEDVYHPNYRLETEAVFRHVEQNLLIYRALLLKCNIGYFYTLLKSFLSGAISEEIQHQRVFDPHKLPNYLIFSEFLVSGYLGVIIYWLDHENISIEDVKKTIDHLINTILLCEAE